MKFLKHRKWRRSSQIYSYCNVLLDSRPGKCIIAKSHTREVGIYLEKIIMFLKLVDPDPQHMMSNFKAPLTGKWHMGSPSVHVCETLPYFQ